MAAAFVIVSLSEWLAGHNRSVPPAAAFLPAQLERESASPVEAPGRLAWAPAADPTGPEAPTIVDPPAAQAPVRELDASQRGREDAEPAEPDAEPQLAKRSGLFRRRRG